LKKILIAVSLICALISLVYAQKDAKDWTTWSDKDVKKILDNSGWGQVQTDTDTSQLMFGQSSKNKNPADPGTMGIGNGSSEGNTNSPSSVNYHIRFLSAKPIRQALARQFMLQQKLAMPTDQLKGLADAPNGEYITVVVYVDSGDRRAIGPAMQAFGGANIGQLQNTTYLERKDGKRIFVNGYQGPGQSPFGAIFRFPRTVDGKPFVSADTGTVRFYAEIPYTANTAPSPTSSTTAQPGTPTSHFIKLDMKFKVADMMVNGQLEY